MVSISCSQVPTACPVAVVHVVEKKKKGNFLIVVKLKVAADEESAKRSITLTLSLNILIYFTLLHHPDKVMILYVSRGLLSSLTEAKQVMEVLSLHNARLEHRVIINTYPVIDGKMSQQILPFLWKSIHINLAI